MNAALEFFVQPEGNVELKRATKMVNVSYFVDFPGGDFRRNFSQFLKKIVSPLGIFSMEKTLIA